MNVKILVAGIVVACVVVAGVGAYFLMNGGEEEKQPLPVQFQFLKNRGGEWDFFWNHLCKRPFLRII
jgi:hypothetical protein